MLSVIFSVTMFAWFIKEQLFYYEIVNDKTVIKKVLDKKSGKKELKYRSKDKLDERKKLKIELMDLDEDDEDFKPLEMKV